MVLAIDVGNTNSVYGLWDGKSWVGVWRRATVAGETEDQLAVWLKGLFELKGFPLHIEGAICGSVVPGINDAIKMLGERWLGVPVHFLHHGSEVGLEVTYMPPTAVGADRIANALGALALAKPPLVVVDFGTATTFDTIDSTAAYIGGAILPGILVSSQAVAQKTAKLPQIEFVAPRRAIGRTTVESLQSGVMLGYAAAIDGLASKISAELEGDVTVFSTGGLGKLFVGLCSSIQRYEPNLTLDGLRIAYERLPR